jgi:hypothetical protein
LPLQCGSGDSMDAPRDLLLTVYRAARERPIEEFQDFTLRLLKPLLQFGSAAWGAGTLLEPGLAVHIAHLDGIPPEDFNPRPFGVARGAR